MLPYLTGYIWWQWHSFHRNSRGSDWARDTDMQAMWRLLYLWSRMFSSFIVLFPMTNELFLLLSGILVTHRTTHHHNSSYYSQPVETPSSPNLHFSQSVLFFLNCFVLLFVTGFLFETLAYSQAGQYIDIISMSWYETRYCLSIW